MPDDKDGASGMDTPVSGTAGPTALIGDYDTVHTGAMAPGDYGNVGQRTATFLHSMHWEYAGDGTAHNTTTPLRDIDVFMWLQNKWRAESSMLP